MMKTILFLLGVFTAFYADAQTAGYSVKINREEFRGDESIELTYENFPVSDDVKDYYRIVILKDPHDILLVDGINQDRLVPVLDAEWRKFSKPLKGKGKWDIRIPEVGKYKAYLVNGKYPCDPTGISVEELGSFVVKSLGTDEVLERKQVVAIFPSPSNGLFSVNAEKELKTVQIYDTNGALIVETGSNQFNLTGQPDGVYMVVIQYADGSIVREKIIKQ
ncbi:T9SS type A sorting domain-containing protein [Flavobacterium supellecticarium]|uniref:T9SS type A sorting domain-containing protein n=2 Tax=Flavobacterium supellecticarium TaxID=2565924 RepID=A0A4S3ZW48_9FLAO|nr:T9SS type A sorting domain-containing protein [Flavobacterium supellecticarium]